MSVVRADAGGVSDAGRVGAMRVYVTTSLEDYVSDRQLAGETRRRRGRLGELLLTLPTLQSISGQLVALVQLATNHGLVVVDNLLQEMLLGGMRLALYDNRRDK